MPIPQPTVLLVLLALLALLALTLAGIRISRFIQVTRRGGVVVSDTSAITNFACVGYLWLLRKLFGVLFVPPEVYREMLTPAPRNRGLRAVKRAWWIRPHEVKNQAKVEELLLRYRTGGKPLSRGEAEAIALALELRARLLVIDERKGRTAAKNEGISIIGVLGVLAQAKEQGLIKKIKPILRKLREKCGFFVKQDLYESFLRDQGEQP